MPICTFFEVLPQDLRWVNVISHINDMVSISSVCFDPSPSDLLAFRLAPPGF